MTSRLLGLLAGTAALALTASLAQAADLPARAAPPPVAAVPLFTWTGFYVGAQVGVAFNDSNNNDFLFNGTTVVEDVHGNLYAVTNNGFFNDDDDTGFVAGGHVGYNVQFGAFVAGLEGDIEWVDIGNDNHGVTLTPIDPLTGAAIGAPFVHSRGNALDFVGSIRGRLGWAVDRTLFYVTGGAAFASFDTNRNHAFVFNGPFFDNGDDDTEWGWTVGAGVEYAFTNNFTARVEYRFTSFDRNRDRFFVNTAFDRDTNADFHTVRVGLSYKFGTY